MNRSCGNAAGEVRREATGVATIDLAPDRGHHP
jgi:hypothetical protein